jgi:hypothetical protein
MWVHNIARFRQDQKPKTIHSIGRQKIFLPKSNKLVMVHYLPTQVASKEMVGKKHLKTIEPFFTILIWLTELYAYYVKFIIIKMLNMK